MDNNEYRAWQAGDGSDNEWGEYSDRQLAPYTMDAIQTFFESEPESPVVTAIWEVVRDLIPVGRKEKLIKQLQQAAYYGDHGMWTYPLLEEVAYAYAINFNARNCLEDFCLTTIRDQLVTEYERANNR